MLIILIKILIILIILIKILIIETSICRDINTDIIDI